MNIETKSIAVNKINALQISKLLPVFAFAIPFLISGPQILTGTIVNSLLYIASAKQLTRKNLYFIALFPSLGALSNGIVFGKFTPFLLYFVPAIWISNMVLILTFSKLKTTFSFPLNIIIPSILKTSVLYLTALTFVSLQLVPKIFITAMGIFQLITAILGGILAYTLFKVSRKTI